MRYLSFSIFLYVLTGCATVAGRPPVTSIDSVPRGADVYIDNSAKPMGKTPFFIEIDGEYKHTLRYSLQKKESIYNMRCGLDWEFGVIGNGVLIGLSAVSGGAAGAIGVGAIVGGTDYLTGNLFNCGGQAVVGFDVPEKDVPRVCRTFIVAPPENVDEVLSDELAQKWIQAVKPKLQPCDKIISYYESKSKFLLFDFTHQKHFNFSSFSQRHITELGIKYKASHMVILKYQVSGTKADDKVQVNAEVYDLHSMVKLSEKEGLPQTSVAVKNLKPSTVRKAVNFAYSLFPNSASFSFVSQDMLNRKIKDHDIYESSSKDIQPVWQYLSGFGLGSYDHPDQYRPWDYSIKLGPSLSAAYFAQKISYTKNNIQEYEENIEVLMVTTLADASFSFHTPIGAFGLDIGLGPTYVRYRDENSKNASLEPTMSVSLGYVAFFSERMFLELSMKVSGFTNSEGDRPGGSFTRIDGWSEVALSIGYYFPEGVRHVRRWTGLDRLSF